VIFGDGAVYDWTEGNGSPEPQDKDINKTHQWITARALHLNIEDLTEEEIEDVIFVAMP
jgi:hypothetical protein